MTMIIHDALHHNIRRLLPVALLGAALLLLGSCGGDDGKSGQEAGPRSQSPAAGHDCAAQVNTDAWDGFLDLARRLDSGQEVTSAEVADFCSGQVMAAWLESISNRTPREPLHMEQWLKGAFWDKVGQGRPRKDSAEARSYYQDLRFNFDHREGIQERIDEFAGAGRQCNVLEKARFWLDEDKIPDPLVVSFVASQPQLRSHHGLLLVDTTVLLASSPRQLEAQLVALLYRERQVMDGPNPLELTGAPSIAHTVRLLLNEGVSGYIEDMPSTTFSSVHPYLSTVHIVPEEVFRLGIRAVGYLSHTLELIADDPAQLEAKGKEIGRSLVAMGALNRGGYAMAATIAGHLGEERLAGLSQDPAGFIAAYQEAALQNQTPLPRPGDPGHELHETMPAFSAKAYDQLMAFLQEEF